MISLLMLWGIIPFLYYMVLISYAVPVVGAFRRRLPFWRIFSAITVASAIGFSILQYAKFGANGLMFSFAEDPYGFSFPYINFLSLLVVTAIFTPLSLACAIDRIMERIRQNQHMDFTVKTPVD